MIRGHKKHRLLLEYTCIIVFFDVRLTESCPHDEGVCAVLLGVDVEMDLQGGVFFVGLEVDGGAVGLELAGLESVGDVEDDFLGLGDGFCALEAKQDFLDVKAADSCHVGIFGADDAGGEDCAQLSGIEVGRLVEHIAVAVLEGDVDESVERGVAEDAPLDDLAVVHLLVVVVDDVADGLVVGVVGLDDNLALVAMSAGTAADLGHLLKRPLESPEVGEVDEVVGAHDAHHADVVEVQPLGNHLCAHEDVDAAVLEIVDNLDIAVLLRGAVQIHAGHLGVGEKDGEVVLDALGAEAFHREVVAMACGALGRQGDGVAAVVAAHAVGGLVVDERHVAMLAGGGPMAVVALDAERETASILEKDDLLMIVQSLLDVVEEELGKMGGVGSLHPHLSADAVALLPHVGTEHLGELDAPIAFLHLAEAILALLGVEIALQRGCRRTQDGLGPPEMGQIDGSVAALVAWGRVVLLEAAVVLLVHNHQAQVVKGEEKGATGPQEHLKAAVLVGVHGAVPHLGTLGGAEARMVDPHAVAKILAQAVDGLCREGYLGQEEECLSALPDGFVDELDIHLRLARRGDAVEERDGLVAMGEVVEGCLLLGIELDGVGREGRLVLLEARHHLLLLLQDPVADKGLEGRLGDRLAVVGVEELATGYRLLAHLAELHKLEEEVDLFC